MKAGKAILIFSVLLIASLSLTYANLRNELANGDLNWDVPLLAWADNPVVTSLNSSSTNLSAIYDITICKDDGGYSTAMCDVVCSDSDCSDDLSTAFNKTGVSSVYIKSGVYPMLTPIQVKHKDLVIKGENPHLNYTYNGLWQCNDAALYFEDGNFEVDGLKMEGNYSIEQYTTSGLQTEFIGICANNTRVRISNNELSGFVYGIYLAQAVNYSWVEDNFIHTRIGTGIAMDGNATEPTQNIKILNNHITNLYDDGIGIFDNLKNIDVSGNTVIRNIPQEATYIAGAAIKFTSKGRMIENVRITNNYLYAANWTYVIATTSSNYEPKEIFISNNVFEDESNMTGLSLQKFSNLTFSNNKIRSTTTKGDSTDNGNSGAGVFFSFMDGDTVVMGNDIECNTASSCIAFFGSEGADNFVVSGNKVFQQGTGFSMRATTIKGNFTSFSNTFKGNVTTNQEDSDYIESLLYTSDLPACQRDYTNHKSLTRQINGENQKCTCIDETWTCDILDETPYSDGVSSDENVLLFNFDGNTIDYAGSGTTGTLGNDAGFHEGWFGKSVNFDGVNDYVQVTHTDNMNFSIGGKITACSWVYANETAGTNEAIARKNNDYFIYKHTSGSVWFRVWESDGTTAEEVDVTIPIDEWAFVCGRANGTHVDTFVNGVKGTSPTTYDGTLQTQSADLYLGANSGTGDDFEGSLDEFTLWNRSLSTAEIRSLYRKNSELIVQDGYLRKGTGFSGSCASSTTLTVVDGLITACS